MGRSSPPMMRMSPGPRTPPRASSSRSRSPRDRDVRSGSGGARGRSSDPPFDSFNAGGDLDYEEKMRAYQDRKRQYDEKLERLDRWERERRDQARREEEDDRRHKRQRERSPDRKRERREREVVTSGGSQTVIEKQLQQKDHANKQQAKDRGSRPKPDLPMFEMRRGITFSRLDDTSTMVKGEGIEGFIVTEGFSLVKNVFKVSMNYEIVMESLFPKKLIPMRH